MPQDQIIPKRNEPRYASDLIIGIKLSKWNPFSKVKARLIDISWSGFQIEFFKSVKIKHDQHIQLHISLEKINGAMGWICIESQIKWFDEQNLKAGGIYTQSNPKDPKTILLEKIIHYIAKQKKNEDNKNCASKTDAPINA